MKPVTEPTIAYSDSNAFALALVGLEAAVLRVDRALPRHPHPAAHSPEADEPVREHPLDLALLGLVSLAERLSMLGESRRSDASTDGRLDTASSVEDVLR